MFDSSRSGWSFMWICFRIFNFISYVMINGYNKKENAMEYALNSVNAQEIVANLLNNYLQRMAMIDKVLENKFQQPYTVFVKYLRTPKSYYNTVNKSITLIFVPNHRFSSRTIGNFTDHFFDSEVFNELENTDTIFNAEWEYRNKMVPLETAITSLLELPFTNIEVIKIKS